MSDSVVEKFAHTLEQLRTTIVETTPQIALALTLLAGGLLLAVLVKFVTRRLVMGVSAALKRLGGKGPAPGMEREMLNRPADHRIANIAAAILFWTVIVITVAAVTHALDLPVISTWVSGLAKYVPRFVIAALILVAGMLLGSILQHLVAATTRSAGLRYGTVLGRLVYGMTLIVTVFVAVTQIGIDVSFLENLIYVVVATVLGGAALAFALGAKGPVTDILESYYLQQSFKVGQTLRFKGIQGRIIELTATNVIVETAEGKVVIPARLFGEEEAMVVFRDR